MDSASAPSTEVAQDFLPFFRVFKDGRVERFLESPIVPASDDPQTGVRSKDVIISSENTVSARLFVPSDVEENQKLPVLVYIHGGAFVIESAFSSQYHNYVSSLVAQAKILAVSIEYRLAPEHPIPACFEDSWTALKWVASHANKGKEELDPWIKNHADLTRIFVAGDSAGGNIAYNMVARASVEGLEDGAEIVGMNLVHPYFGRGQEEKLWEALCEDAKGPKDPRLNPMAHPDLLSNLKCRKILIFTAEKDFIRERGQLYYEAMKKSGWGGEAELIESEGEEHVFHLIRPDCHNARILMKRLVSFFNE